MIFENVRYDRENGELCFKCSPLEGVKYTYSFRPGNYDIVKHQEKRSRNANNYAWQLIDKIAAKMRLSKTEVYRNAIKDTPGVTKDVILIKKEAVNRFANSWERGHLGRQVQELPDTDPDYVNLIVLYGSSDYSKGQMSHFIDVLTQDAMALGIDTKPQEYVDSLLEDWRLEREIRC